MQDRTSSTLQGFRALTPALIVFTVFLVTSCGNQRQEVTLTNQSTVQAAEREQIKGHLDSLDQKVSGLQQELQKSRATNDQILELLKAQQPKPAQDLHTEQSENLDTPALQNSNSAKGVQPDNRPSAIAHARKRRHTFYRPPQQCVCPS
jgi:hypothetical protein